MALLLIALQPVPSDAQDPGLDSVPPLGPFLNGALPLRTPSGNGEWVAVNAFPNLTFTDPTWMLPVPGTSQLIVSEKRGRLILFENDETTTQSTTLLSLSSQTRNSGDSGCYSLAFHPEFGQPGSPNAEFLYVYYRYTPDKTVDDKGYLRLSRFTWPAGANSISDASEFILINQYDRQDWHSGGGLFFGNDDFLYLSIGDEGGPHDQFNVTQQIDKYLFSGVMRIDVDQQGGDISHPIRRQPQTQTEDPPPAGWPNSFTQGYFVPSDNPWIDANGGNLEEFWAIGTRSPWRMTLDPPTGDIYVPDIGQWSREEVSVVVSGANLQWPYQEGDIAGPKPKPTPLIGFDLPPLHTYERGDGSCIIGGSVYRGQNHQSSLDGKYVFADRTTGHIWALSRQGATVTRELLLTLDGPDLSGFGLDADGEIYPINLSGGTILRLERSGTIQEEPPPTLSQIGAFTDLATLTPVDGLIPYQVNAPLWSDDADKQRWIGVPHDGTLDRAGEQIGFSEGGNWSFPVGSVFIKQFTLDGRRLETRFLVHGDDENYYGVTYRWREDQSDADLLLTGEEDTLDINGQQYNWTFPSRSDCMQCHTTGAGRVLGLRTHQLNGDHFYPTTGRTANQLLTLNHLGLFNPSLDSAQIPGFLKSVAISDTSASDELRSRSYLDSNCSHCHNPTQGIQDFDFRLSSPLLLSGIINGDVLNEFGIAGAKVLVPGDPDKSLVYVRQNTTDPVLAMPPLARHLIDIEAVSVIRDWILNIAVPNGSPTIDPIPDQYTPSGRTVILQVVASDPEREPLTFTASGLPAGLSIDSSTGLVSGTSTQAGTSTVTVAVTDPPGDEASTTFSWAIGPANLAPTIDPVADQSHQRGQSVTLALLADDPEGNLLSYSTSGLPPGLSIDTSSGIISGQPVTSGAYGVTVSVDDGFGGVATAFLWTITPSGSGGGPAPDDLVVHLPFEEGTGDNAFDVSGLGNDGYLLDGVAWIDGQAGNGIETDGIDAITRVNHAPSLHLGENDGDFTVAFWVNLQEDFTGNWRGIAGKGTSGDQRAFALFLRPSSNQIQFSIKTTADDKESGLSLSELTVGQWTHLTLVKQGNELIFYFNTLFERRILLSAPTVGTTQDFFLGRGPGSAAPTWAKYDNLQIYNCALSASEVAEASTWNGGSEPGNTPPVVNDQSFTVEESSSNGSYAGTITASDPDSPLTFSVTGGSGAPVFAIDEATGVITVADSAQVTVANSPFTLDVVVTDDGIPALTDSATITIDITPPSGSQLPPGLQAWLPFEEGSGAVAGDATGIGHDGLLGTGVVWISGQTGSGVSTNGQAGSTIGIAHTQALDLGAGDGDFTVAFWVNLQEGPTGSWRGVAGKGVSSSQRAFSLYLHPADNRVLFSISTLNGKESQKSDTELTVGQWAHVAYVKQGNQLRLFLDTQLEASLTLSAPTAGTTQDFFLGRAPGNAVLVAAQFDNLQVYDRALSAEEVVNASTLIGGEPGNNPPAVNDQSFTTNEGVPDGAVVGTITAVDVDTGPEGLLSYTVTGGGGTGILQVDPASGEITVVDSTQLAPGAPYTLDVDVSDGGTPSLTDSAVITINVNVAPAIGNQSFAVEEGSPNGSYAGTVTASDPDSPLTYSVTGGSGAPVFAIDEATGVITVADSAQVIVANSPFTLDVTATDDGIPALTDSATITIDVTPPSGGQFPPGLQAWLPFEEGSGLVAGDATGMGHDGLLGADVIWSSGQSGSGVSTSGQSGSHVEIPHGPALDLGGGDSDFTVAFWVNLQEGPTGSWRGVAGKGVSSSQRAFSLYLHPADNRVLFSISTLNGKESQKSDTELTVGQWAHVAYVKQGNQLRLFLDTQLEGSLTLSAPTAGTTQDFFLGRAPGNAAPTLAWYDGLQIYSRALSEAEIQQAQSVVDTESAFASSETADAEPLPSPTPPFADSHFRIITASMNPADELVITWQSVVGRNYEIQHSADLGAWSVIGTAQGDGTVKSFTADVSEFQGYLRISVER